MAKFRRDMGIPEGIGLELAPPHTPLNLGPHADPNAIPFRLLFFVEGGLRLPLRGLMLDLIALTGLCPTQFSTSVYRIVNSFQRLKDLSGVDLGWCEILYYYTLGRGNDMVYLKIRPNRSPVILGLPDRQNEGGEDVLLVRGDFYHRDLSTPPIPASFQSTGKISQPRR